jgi:hypothetical protein
MRFGIHGVGALNHAPEVFVLGNLQIVQVADGVGCGLPVGGMGLAEEAVGGESAGQNCGALEEGATVARNHTKDFRRLDGEDSTEKCRDALAGPQVQRKGRLLVGY